MNINTERCQIRHFEERDIDDFMAYRNNAFWMRYQGFKGLTKAEYQSILIKKPEFHDGVQLAVICKANKRLIGDIYLRQDGCSFWLGYTIHPCFARQGYACEAVQGVMAWIQATGSDQILAEVLPENIPSIGLLHKLGFHRVGCSEDGEELYRLNLRGNDADNI